MLLFHRDASRTVLPTIGVLGLTMQRTSGSRGRSRAAPDRLAATARRLQASLASLHSCPLTPHMPTLLSHGFREGAVELSRQSFGETEPSAGQDPCRSMVPRQAVAPLKLVRT